jgi:hypothetical protein
VLVEIQSQDAKEMTGWSMRLGKERKGATKEKGEIASCKERSKKKGADFSR